MWAHLPDRVDIQHGPAPHQNEPKKTRENYEQLINAVYSLFRQHTFSQEAIVMTTLRGLPTHASKRTEKAREAANF